MANNDIKTQLILSNLVHDPDINNILTRLGLRMVFTKELYLAESMVDITKYEDSYIKCLVQSSKPGRVDYISADSSKFSLLMELVKKDPTYYTYSKISYYDKVAKKPYEFRNANMENNTTQGIGAKIKSLFKKRK